MHSLTLFFLLLNCLAINALVHRFTAQQYNLPNEMAIEKHRQLNNHLIKQFGREGHQLFKAISQRDSASIRLSLSNWVLLGNITVGTPAKQFTVEFDTFFAEDLHLLGPKLNQTRQWRSSRGQNRNVYNESASSSSVSTNGNFSHSGWQGHLSTDIVDVQGQSANLTFGVIDRAAFVRSKYSRDGLLGLSIKKSSNNITNAVTQLLANAEKPVITQWWNITGRAHNVQITLGAEDTDNCQSPWTYVQGKGSGYTFRINSGSANVNGSTQSAIFNSTAILLPYLSGVVTTKEKHSLFVNASNAVYNSTSREYVVDCDLSKSGSVTLSIGDNSSDTTKQLVLSGTDFIFYNKKSGKCYLNVQVVPGWVADKFTLIGSTILYNHCLGYNTKENLVGFADVKNRVSSARY